MLLSIGFNYKGANMNQKLLAEDNVSLAAKLKVSDTLVDALIGHVNFLRSEVRELERELKEQRETIKELKS